MRTLKFCVVGSWEMGESPRILPNGLGAGSLGQNNTEAEGKSNSGFFESRSFIGILNSRGSKMGS